MLQFLCWLAPQALQIAAELFAIADFGCRLALVWLLMKAMWRSRRDDGTLTT